MRVYVIDRQRLSGDPLPLPHDLSYDPELSLDILDKHAIPDGLPFVLEDDGRIDGCASINQYFRDAWAQRGLTLSGMKNLAYSFVRLLTHARSQRAITRAKQSGVDVHEWCEEFGEPRFDLTSVTRDDLISYRDARIKYVEASTLANELHRVAAFFDYAVQMGWMSHDPTPRWGHARRNTLIPRTRKVRVEKFLNGRQTKHFLEVGLRADASEEATTFPERDYSYGLMIATTGLRRSEAGLLLDCEIPEIDDMPLNGMSSFLRTGKKDVRRRIYITRELVSAIRPYRLTERPRTIESGQRRLRRLRRDGKLLEVEGVTSHRGQPAVVIEGTVVPTDRLTNAERRRAVRVLPNGQIEPLALFISRSSLPPVIAYWDEIFQRARDRVDLHAHPNRPPAHITVSPHTLRHTFAVRMLAALMEEGREKASDPYFLLVNPLLTVQQLLGHASVETTQAYLFAAETWNDDIPRSMRSIAATMSGQG